MRPAAIVVQVARATVKKPTVVIAGAWIDRFMMGLAREVGTD
jgi:hypothetical protein